jgi:chemotaxis protein methyltransferase CheR
VRDEECVRLLQEVMPGLQLRWPGFRKVRRTVCRRLGRRLRELGLSGPSDYRELLERSPAEWRRLDAMCRIPISRFMRDRGVTEALADVVLPAVAAAARREGRASVRAWSAGCASGEEAYSLLIAWRLRVAPAAPGISLTVLGTDVDPAMVERAHRGRYPASAIAEVPDDWRAAAFARRAGEYVLRAEFRRGATFRTSDIRDEMPPGPFDVILCRNLAFTYFAPALQRRVLRGLWARLAPGGFLVVGAHEHPPQDAEAPLEPLPGAPAVLRRLPPEGPDRGAHAVAGSVRSHVNPGPRRPM